MIGSAIASLGDFVAQLAGAVGVAPLAQDAQHNPVLAVGQWALLYSLHRRVAALERGLTALGRRFEVDPEKKSGAPPPA